MTGPSYRARRRQAPPSPAVSEEVTSAAGDNFLEDEVSDPQLLQQAAKRHDERRSQEGRRTNKDKNQALSPPPAGSSIHDPNIIPTIIIEYCLNPVCILLLERKANELKIALEKEISDIKVAINPEVPLSMRSEGWFQVRTDYGKILRDYANLKQPFQDVAELEVSEVVSEVQALINNG